MHDDFEDMLNESTAVSAGVSVGEKLDAKIVSIGKDHVFLDIGIRAEGLLLRAEVERDGELTVAVGDRLPVFTVGARDGAVMCARRLGAATGGPGDRRDDAAAVLAQIKDAYDAGMPIEGSVKEVNKGGFSVSVLGQRAFCPVSQIDRVYCEKPDEHLGRTYAFVIMRFEEDGRNIVLSRRAILEREAEETAKVALEQMHEGDVVEGEVTSLQKYGAFVDVGGVEGLVHVSELSHTRIGHPDEVLSKGQRVRVQIKEIDRGRGKISLSLKSLLDDPWNEALASLSAGRIAEGKVSRLAAFGAFVELYPGVEGLVHVSQMAEDRRVNNPREMVSPGAKVRVRVIEIDPDRRRISLALVDENAEEEREATEEFRASAASHKRGMGTLGDLLGASLKKK
jgi:small subunit ribosomal protein S1